MNEVQIPKGRIVIHREENQIKKFEELARQLEESATSAIAEYQALGLGEITLQQLQACVSGNPEEFVRQKISGNKAVVVGGMVLAAEKVKEMIEIPDLSEFKVSLIRLKNQIRPIQSHSGISLSSCSIIDGKVVINQEAAENWIESQCQYATTEAEKESFLVIQKIAEALEFLYQKHRIVILPNTNSLAGSCILKHHFDTYPDPQVRTEINAYLFRQHFNPSRY
jgi:hypothetical protein